MRKLIAALLTAATLATPAMAQWHDRDKGADGVQAAPERSERRGNVDRQRSQQTRPQAPAQVQRPQAYQPQQQRGEWQGRHDGQNRSGWNGGERGRGPQGTAAQPGFQGRVYDQRRQQLDEMRARAQTQQDRRDWQQNRNDWQRDRRNWQDRRDDHWQGRRDNNDHRWDQNWRRDQRYDWQRYRYQNRNTFHLPRYYAPRGWGYGYNRFSLGAYLNAPLFAQNYWIDDPFDYRLPPAYGPYRWVRYYNDVLLVDVRNGYVVDAIYDFFW